jgi:hypothetical protein
VKINFLKTLTEILKKLDWSISSISSDALRKELVNKYRENSLILQKKEAFYKTAKMQDQNSTEGLRNSSMMQTRVLTIEYT